MIRQSDSYKRIASISHYINTMACKAVFFILCAIVVNGVLCKTEVDDEMLNRFENLENQIRKQAAVIEEQFRLIRDLQEGNDERDGLIQNLQEGNEIQVGLIQNLQKVNQEQDRRIIDLEKLTTTIVKEDTLSVPIEDEAQIKEGDAGVDEKVKDGVVPKPESVTMRRENASAKQTYAENSRIDKGRRITSHPNNKVAFTAYYDHADWSNRLHNGETIIFNKVLYNEGNDYNIYSGIFSCSQSGVYLFSLSVATESDNTVAKIVIDGRNQLDSIAEGDQVTKFIDAQGSTTLITHVSEGQHVWVLQYFEDKVNVRGRDEYRFTSFSGVLLYPN